MTFRINLTMTYYFETFLFSSNVNSPRRCYVNNEVDSMTLWLT